MLAGSRVAAKAGRRALTSGTELARVQEALPPSFLCPAIQFRRSGPSTSQTTSGPSCSCSWFPQSDTSSTTANVRTYARLSQLTRSRQVILAQSRLAATPPEQQPLQPSMMPIATTAAFQLRPNPTSGQTNATLSIPKSKRLEPALATPTQGVALLPHPTGTESSPAHNGGERWTSTATACR